MGKTYKVVGPLPVCDVDTGGTVTEEQLVNARANINALIPFHLEEIIEAAPKTIKVDK